METQENYNVAFKATGETIAADNVKINEHLNRIRGLEAELQVLSISLRRANMANALGQPFAGNRDLYKVLGYKADLEIADYAQAYKRNEMGGRIIDLPPKDTWRKPPTLKEDGKEDTPWLALFNAMAEQLDLLSELTTIDRLSGIGRYGALLIGTRDMTPLLAPEETPGEPPARPEQEIGDLSQPRGTLSGPEAIIYLRSCSEETAEITEIEDDTGSPRYGLPTKYLITTTVDPSSSGDAQQTNTQEVHWSRVIHVAEDTLDDKVYGRPRLERVFNRLVDYEKVLGGASEATWLTMNRGMQADVAEGSDLTDDQLTDLEDQLQDYVHGLRRILQTSGVSIRELGGQVINPSGLIDKLTAALAAGSDIPQRILVGSERGQLASTQDQETWWGAVENRQNQYAWPKILKAFIDWCVAAGALPPHGKLTCEWPPMTKETKAQKYALNKLRADVVKTLGLPVVLPDEIREMIDLEPLGIAPAPTVPPATQAAAHGGVLVNSKCPLCGGTQGMRYAGHGPLVLCLNCRRTYDPTYWGYGRRG